MRQRAREGGSPFRIAVQPRCLSGIFPADERISARSTMTTLATPVKDAVRAPGPRARVADRAWYAYAAKLLPAPREAQDRVRIDAAQRLARRQAQRRHVTYRC